MRRAILFVLLTCAACSSRPAADQRFAGTWVMNVHGRPFMVLTLQSENDLYVGTLTWPRQKTISGDGRSFSGIGRETTTRRLTSEALRQTTLRMVVEPPEDPDDKDEIELSLTAPDEGRLTLVGTPFEPWPMIRVTGESPPQVWTGWVPTRSYVLQDPAIDSNPEMAGIYQADQAPRQSLKSFEANAKQIEKDDAARREKVRALIAGGQLRAAEDYRLAAMIFQHGSEPRDYLFAHTLALVAMEKGDRSASWIAAASLDRYLRSIDRPQIFGLQFKPGGSERQPVDDDLISDALRQQLGIPTLAEQQAQMQQLAGK